MEAVSPGAWLSQEGGEKVPPTRLGLGGRCPESLVGPVAFREAGLSPSIPVTAGTRRGFARH